MASEWRRETRARDWIASLGETLWFTDDPLTPSQARQLVPLFAASNTSAIGQPAQYDWEALKARARGVLSDAQLEGVAALQAQQQFNAMLATPPAVQNSQAK